jgi:hypothetical protein
MAQLGIENKSICAERASASSLETTRIKAVALSFDNL